MVSPSPHNISITQPTLDETKLTWFRFGSLGENIILTTDAGDWHLLSEDTFSMFISGALEEDSEDYAQLLRKGFIRNGFDAELQGGLIRRTKTFLHSGVHHHRIHLSSDQGALSVEQAKAILDHVFTSQAERLTLVMVQGPTAVDAGLLSFIHEFAEEKNKYERRHITYRLHGSLDGLDEKTIATIIEKKIQLNALFDGSESLHATQRDAIGSADHTKTHARILMANEAAEQAHTPPEGFRVSVEVHVGNAARGQAKSIIEGLQSAQIQHFRLTPILVGDHAITPDDYGEFIDDLLAHLDALQPDDTRPCEEQIAALSAWIRSGEVSPPVTSTRPATGYNARSYNTTGDIYPCCSALKLAEQGDATFLLGNVATDSMDTIAGHATLRTLIVASVTDCLPGYQHLWSTPYLSPDPVAAYTTTGNIFTTTTTSVFHRATLAMVERPFLHTLAQEDGSEE